MKISNYRSYHTHIGTEWECIENIWDLKLEYTDPYDAKIKHRFEMIEVIQRVYLNTNKQKEISTWYKGIRSQTFDANTKDKEKLFIIEEVIKFLYNFESHALVAQWSEQSAHN